MRSTRRLYLGSLAVAAPFALLFACGEGERRVDVLVEVDDPGQGSPGPVASPQAGRASPSRGGSTSSGQGGAGPSAPTAGKSSGNGGSGPTTQGGSTSSNGGKASNQGGSTSSSGGSDATASGGTETETATCGNGEREGDEECDDGDTQNDDGCTADCKYLCESCACETCSQTNCTEYATYDLEGNDILANLVSDCYEASGTASQGPSLGLEKAELCADLVSCVRSSGCAGEAEGPGLEAEMCYCGTPLLECLEEEIKGNCKTEFELGAESGEYAEVMERFSDVTYAVGLAVQLLRCQSELCASECGMKTE